MSLVPQHILLTGASGFLGTAILQELHAQGHVVHTLGRQPGSHYRVDLASQVPVLSGKYNTVIHAAGKAHMVPKTPAEAADFFAVNQQGTKHLCQALENLPSLPAALVFVSTVAVYGREEGEGIGEGHELGGRSPYARSKILAEEYLQQWCTDHGVRLTILRLPLVVGHQAPGNLGSMEQAIRKGRYFHIGGGKARKSMVLADDVAKSVLHFAGIGGIYNLTDGEHPTFAALANAIARRYGRQKLPNLPLWLAKLLAYGGQILGPRFPLSKERLLKITGTLIFDDRKARQQAGWLPRSVLAHFKN